MNEIAFRVVPARSSRARVARVFIDGRDLIELAAEFEADSARAEGHPKLAGKYDGLNPEAWADLPEQYGDGRAAVLCCECGEVGCWPLRVRITLGDQVVTWSDFEQPYRPGWSHAGLGPFTFARAQYDEAVTSLVRSHLRRSGERERTGGDGGSDVAGDHREDRKRGRDDDGHECTASHRR